MKTIKRVGNLNEDMERRRGQDDDDDDDTDDEDKCDQTKRRQAEANNELQRR